MSNDDLSKTLIIFKMLPDELLFFAVPNYIAENYSHFFQLAHNKFFNLDDDNSGLKFIFSATSEKVIVDEFIKDDFAMYAGIFLKYKVDSVDPIIDNISRVVLTGFGK